MNSSRRGRWRRAVGAIAALCVALVSAGIASAEPAAAIGSYSISGTVYLGDTSHPAGSGEVRINYAKDAFASFPSGASYVSTAADGTFSINVLDAGAYSLHFDYAGASRAYQSEFWNDKPKHDGQDAVVIAGTNVVGIAPVLALRPVVTGSMAMGESGYVNAYAGPRVSILGMANGVWSSTPVASVSIGWDGTFSAPIDSGPFQVIYSAIGHRLKYGELSTIAPGQTRVLPEVVLQPKGIVAGKVSLGTSGTPPGSRIIDVTVSYCDGTFCQGPYPADAPDANGDFYFDDLNDYTYTYTFRTRTGTEFAPTTTTVAISPATNTHVGLDVVLELAGTVTGHLTLGSTGPPAVGYYAYLHRQGETGTVTARGDANGDYRFAQLRPGTYTISFQPPDWLDYYYAGIGPFTVEPGGTTVQNTHFSRVAYVDGRLVDVVGRPTSGYVVAYDCSSGFRQGYAGTDPGGIFSWQAPRNGQFGFAVFPDDPRLAATSENFYAQQAPPGLECFDTGEGGTVPVTVVARPGGIITGRIALPGVVSPNLGLVGLQFERLDPETAEWNPYLVNSMINDDSTYRAINVLPGLYRIHLSYQGTPVRESWTSPFVVRTGTRVIRASLGPATGAGAVASFPGALQGPLEAGLDERRLLDLLRPDSRLFQGR